MATKTKDKKPSPAFAFIVKCLEKNPEASFRSIRDKAEKKGHKIYPISFGRAQKLLGLAGDKKKSAPRKVKVSPVAKSKPSAPKKRGRPLKDVASSVASVPVSSLSDDGPSVNDLVMKYADLKGELGYVVNQLEKHGITVPA